MRTLILAISLIALFLALPVQNARAERIGEWQHQSLKATDGTEIKLDYKILEYRYYGSVVNQVSDLWIHVMRADLNPNDQVRIVMINRPYWATTSNFEEVTQANLQFTETGRFSTNSAGILSGNVFNARQEIAVVINGQWLKVDNDRSNFELRLVPFINP